MKASLARFIRALPLLILAPFLLLMAAVALAATDLAWLIAGRRRKPSNARPETKAASLVIPNWNGIDLLERFVPSWIAAIAGHPGSEIVVVDNGSTDGSADWLRTNYPEVRVIALPENLGFGGGSNAGFRAAKNDVVVLLNSDMRVEPDFLTPLLAGFTDETVFAVSCQIFLGDKSKRREETGLTEGWWQDGGLRVGHREDPAVDCLFPCFYGGGGSCAFDRRKFFELGGFDELLAPFYLAGRCCTNPQAWCITSTAGRSGSDSATITSRPFCARISCSSAGKTSTAGTGSRPIFFFRSPPR
jgi:hypothetical protein